jgi:hypothetical protein
VLDDLVGAPIRQSDEVRVLKTPQQIEAEL